MTDSRESDLTTYLEFISTATHKLREIPPGMKYGSYEEMILANGRFFTHLKPDSLVLGEMGDCYVNALRYAELHGMRYAEGYAISPGLPIPVMHGWAATDSDEAIDLTWPYDDCVYFGVTWEPEEALARMIEVGHYGILGNDWLNKNKLLKEGP